MKGKEELRIAIIYDLLREDTLGEHYKRMLKKTGCMVEHFWLRDSARIEPVFDAYLRIDDGDYQYDIPHDKLKPSLFYASDVHLKKPFLAIRRIARFYDHVFCAQYAGYVRLRAVYGEKISWLPHACDEELLGGTGFKPAPAKRGLDVAFVGNDGGIPRKFLLQELRERYPSSYIGNAPYTRLADIYSSAKIGFNYSIANDINMRIFEIMGCGAMLLTNRIEDAGFDSLFMDRKNLAVYNSPKEMFSLIGYYLKNDSERERIAEAGRQLAGENHTYAKRASFMLGIIGSFAAT